MNRLSLYTRLYGVLHNYKGIHFRLLSPFRYLVRRSANRVLPYYLQNNHQALKGVVKKDLIVSFTSFPARINIVWMVVESLRNQSVLPEKVVLWLSKDQFPDCKIPDSLSSQIDDFFEVRFVEGDIRSHKKYYYALKEYPDKSIITVDDDIFYHPDTIKYLVKSAEIYPGAIIGNIVKIVTKTDNTISPYASWPYMMKSGTASNLIPIGAGGVLYPAHSLDPIVLREDLFMKLAPMADDLWLNVVSRYTGTKVAHSKTNLLFLEIQSDAPSLASVNNGLGRNDVQLADILEYFKSEHNHEIYE